MKPTSSDTLGVGSALLGWWSLFVPDHPTPDCDVPTAIVDSRSRRPNRPMLFELQHLQSRASAWGWTVHHASHYSCFSGWLPDSPDELQSLDAHWTECAIQLTYDINCTYTWTVLLPCTVVRTVDVSFNFVNSPFHHHHYFVSSLPSTSYINSFL